MTQPPHLVSWSGFPRATKQRELRAVGSRRKQPDMQCCPNGSEGGRAAGGDAELEVGSVALGISALFGPGVTGAQASLSGSLCARAV